MSPNASVTQREKPPTASARLHGLDALRAGALWLGIVLHSLMPFAPGMPWFITDASTDPLAHVPIYVIHLFRMVTFMALAGYFGRMVLHRRGTRAYVKDRLLRIGLPIPAFWPFAVLSLILLAGFGAAYRGITPPVQPEVEGVSPLLLLFSPGHLWFLVVLLECVLVTVAVRAIMLRMLGPARCAAIAERVGAVLSSPVGVVVAAVPYVACLVLQGASQFGIIAPVTIVPSVSALTAYLGAFLVGWFVHARGDALNGIARQWPAQLVLALALSLAGFVTTPEQFTLAGHATIIALAGWSWTFALIGLCVRFLNREVPVIRYAADSSYWVCLLHLPLLVGIEIFLADAPLPIIVKLVITWVAVTAVLLLTYDLFVRSTWIGTWLNGHRRPRAIFTTSRRSRSRVATNR